MAAQELSSEQEQAQAAPPRPSSGIDPADFEVAAQLISHSQGRLDSGNGHLGNADLDQKTPDSGVAPTQDRIGDGNGSLDGPENARRSSSRDRIIDSHYSPLALPTTSGQRCR